ncbi:uncharacterized protein LOC124263781 [Haliotis rubra]|uniref:uncharacterized protein LOC124263781 n=1 Tax=Haliotis rubra TaxID=36100 RepID=UPI001EE505BC|nr:uncharacterized protein LOC124263781 [Haliotis rubra]
MVDITSGITLRPIYSRLISERGATNIQSVSVANRSTKYVSDICTTLIDIQWRWNLLLFFGGFTLTWLIFAAYYYLLAYVHGDLFKTTDDDWLPCVENIQSYASAFLFSIETMTTIGYGYRFVTEACPGAYLGVIAQSILGAALQFALAGLVVAKVRRSKKRSGTILFSKVACIFAEDLKLRLAIRVGDMRKSHIIGAHARGYFILKTFSKTGDKIPVQYFNMDFRSEGGDERLFLPWPTYIVHNIDEESPLYNLSRDDAMQENFELIVVLEAVSSTLSASFQVRKSYHPWEIRWGHRFLPLGVTYQDVFDEHVIDYEHFHDTKAVSTPMVSAKDIDEMAKQGNLSTENLQRRRDSRAESDLFFRQKTVSDTFLGAEEDLSVSEFSMSDSMSLQETLRRISTVTYHGPGTFEKRRTIRDVFRSPPIAYSRTRRHSTGQFLDSLTRNRRPSHDLSSSRRPSQDSSGRRTSQDLIFNRRTSFDFVPVRKHSMGGDSSDLASIDEGEYTDELGQHEESGPRYIKRKKVTLNMAPVTETLRKRSDPGMSFTRPQSALHQRRRHSTWQFAEQDSFIRDYKQIHPELYLDPHIEEIESGASDEQDSDNGGAAKEEQSRDDDENLNAQGYADENLVSPPKDGTTVQELGDSKIVITGSFRRKYVVQKVPEIVIEDVSTSAAEGAHLHTNMEVFTEDADEEDAVRDDKVEDAEVERCLEHNDPPTSPEKGTSLADTDSSPEAVNFAYVYDSEDDIGYREDILPGDMADGDEHRQNVNYGFESDDELAADGKKDKMEEGGRKEG